jgi:uridylate kinase
MKPIHVISLGGSLLVPDTVDVAFLKSFRQFILDRLPKARFCIITGGGKTARTYAYAAAEIAHLNKEDIDWLGIHATRLNAHLIRTIFRDVAHPRIIKNPTEHVKFTEDVLVAAGWKPGCSTDYDAVLLAEHIGAKLLVNLTNTDYVYDKDPRKFKDAKPLKSLSWKEFRKMVGDTWDPGMNVPFDPVASRRASELGMQVLVINGKNLENLGKALDGKPFVGTTIG